MKFAPSSPLHDTVLSCAPLFLCSLLCSPPQRPHGLSRIFQQRSRKRLRCRIRHPMSARLRLPVLAWRRSGMRGAMMCVGRGGHRSIMGSRAIGLRWTAMGMAWRANIIPVPCKRRGDAKDAPGPKFKTLKTGLRPASSCSAPRAGWR